MKDIANSFNEKFSNIGLSLYEKIDMSRNDMTYNDYLANSADSHFSFSPVLEKEILNIISILKKNFKKFWNRWHVKCTSKVNSR